MHIGYHRFQLGDFNCICVSDGTKDYVPKNFFNNVTDGDIETALQEKDLPTDKITTPYTNLLISTGKHQVLVDMGAGHLGPDTGKLVTNLRDMGIDPSEVDTMIVTHAHPDHIGGTLDDAGQLNFPNASYFVSKEEWDFWFSDTVDNPAPQRFIDVARNNLGAFKGQVNLTEGKTEILPGISVIPAPGHTPGHLVVAVSSRNQELLYIADTVLFPLHLENPDWLPIYDIQPEKAAESKQTIFDLAANSQALVIGQHFPPFPSLGTVTKKDVGWLWQPISTGV